MSDLFIPPQGAMQPTIGSKIFHFDQNLRVYSNTNGSGPVWREHWRSVTISGETSRSWVTLYGKVSKRDLQAGVLSDWVLSKQEIEEREWVYKNRYKIVRLLEGAQPSTIRVVAKLLNYQPIE